MVLHGLQNPLPVIPYLARPTTFFHSAGAAAAYVAMTRGRHSNTAHLVAESLEDARKQWVDVFSRDRAALGPAHARRLAVDAIDRYGPAAVRPPTPRLPVPEYRPPISRPSGIGL